MDETFHKLLANATKKQEKNFGNPWEVIPIKNKKYSIACEEIHLANQKLQGLVNFKDFPNVEVLWINDNKFESIESLDDNFRIKQLYAFNNKIKTLDGSLKYFKHLDTLLLNNNELRNLDQNLLILKDFTHLKNLNLFGNPLAEEPNYRLRIIAQLPWLELLDQHWITYDERVSAEQWIKQQSQDTLIKKEKKPQNKFKNFSQAEKELYSNAARIKQQIKQKEFDENRLYKESLRPRQYDNVLPKPTIVWELGEQQNDRSKFVTEWEKNRIRNTFKEQDKDKKGFIKKDLLVNVFGALQEDSQLLGKVPDCSFEQFQAVMVADSNGNIQWDNFRFNLNKIQWKKLDLAMLQEIIDQKFLDAHRAKNRGNKDQAYQNIYQAVRLQNVQQLEQKDQNNTYNDKNLGSRSDFIDLGTFKFRKNFSLQNEKIYL